MQTSASRKYAPSRISLSSTHPAWTIYLCTDLIVSFFHHFAEVSCSDPSSVKDGFIEVSNFKGKYVYGSLATYHCNPGYILWGNASRLCAEDGEWTGGQPQCKPITCGQPPEVENGHFRLVNGSDTSWRSKAIYRCRSGYRMREEARDQQPPLLGE